MDCVQLSYLSLPLPVFLVLCYYFQAAPWQVFSIFFFQSLGGHPLFFRCSLGYHFTNCLVYVTKFLLMTCLVQIHFLMCIFSTIAGRSVIALDIPRRYRSILLMVTLNLWHLLVYHLFFATTGHDRKYCAHPKFSLLLSSQNIEIFYFL